MIAPKEFQLTVEEWLKAVGCTPTRQDDPNAEWHVQFDYPVRSPHVMHVIAPKNPSGSVVIATATQVSKEHVDAFGELDEEGKRDFLWGLRRALNQLDVDFQLEGAQGPLDLPSRYQVSQVRYLDGINRDSFMRSLGSVFKAELNATWTFVEKLGDNGQGPGMRFDFKRLGI
jgi:hypothetical protein